MFAKGKSFSRGITKAQILAGGRDDDKILIDEHHIGTMFGNQGKRFAHPYEYAKNPADLAQHVKERKAKNPRYDFDVVHQEPYKDYAWKASQFNYNNIRHNDLRDILSKNATQVKIINKAKASSEDKQKNPHRIWAISAEGMYERNKALRRWLDKDGYQSGIKSVSFFSGGSNRNDDKDFAGHYDDAGYAQKSTNIENIQTIVYWKDDATDQQKQAVQAVLSRYFDLDLNSESHDVADFADADVRNTEAWHKKLGLDKYQWGALKVDHW